MIIARENLYKLKDAGSRPLELGAEKSTRSNFVTFEVIIERNLDRQTEYTVLRQIKQEQDVAVVDLKNTVQIESERSFKDYLGALADFGGLFVIFYVLFYVFTSCCTKNHFENYLVSEIFTEKDIMEVENDIEANDAQKARYLNITKNQKVAKALNITKFISTYRQLNVLQFEQTEREEREKEIGR